YSSSGRGSGRTSKCGCSGLSVHRGGREGCPWTSRTPSGSGCLSGERHAASSNAEGPADYPQAPCASCCNPASETTSLSALRASAVKTDVTGRQQPSPVQRCPAPGGASAH